MRRQPGWTRDRGNASNRRYTIAILVCMALGVAILAAAILLAGLRVAEQQSRQRIDQAVGMLVKGTSFDGKPADQTPGYRVSGNILCLDDCLHASLDLPVSCLAPSPQRTCGTRAAAQTPPPALCTPIPTWSPATGAVPRTTEA